jgi:hypothetical protein
MFQSANSNPFPRGCNGFPLNVTSILHNDNAIPDILRGVLKIKNAKTKRSIADLVATLETLTPSPNG